MPIAVKLETICEALSCRIEIQGMRRSRRKASDRQRRANEAQADEGLLNAHACTCREAHTQI